MIPDDVLLVKLKKGVAELICNYLNDPFDFFVLFYFTASWLDKWREECIKFWRDSR